MLWFCRRGTRCTPGTVPVRWLEEIRESMEFFEQLQALRNQMPQTALGEEEIDGG